MKRGITFEEGVIKPVDGRGLLRAGDECYIGQKHFGTVLNVSTETAIMAMTLPRKQPKGLHIRGGGFAQFGIPKSILDAPLEGLNYANAKMSQ